jgi:glycosyltransferase involved in cell wall biosynthesis
MKLLINASTLSATGVVQVAVSFINECKKIEGNTYYVVLSQQVSSELDISSFGKNFTFYLIKNHPKNLLSGLSSRIKLKSIERTIKPDSIFSVFGPSWFTPNAPHLMGYAYPHYVYPDSPFFARISLWSRVLILFKRRIHTYFLRKNGSYFVCETDDVSERLHSILNFPKENIFTVSNTYGEHFNNVIKFNKTLLPKKKSNEFRFLSLCSLHEHKNLKILNQVIPLLDKKLNFKFILTVDSELFEESFSEESKSFIYNIGRINIADCPQIYSECDALFLPTLLECFSANYPEAMKMGKPILTSDLNFAKKVCQDAAFYFDPLDTSDIAQKIIRLMKDELLYKELVLKGKNRVELFPDASQRARKYIEICKKISKIC